MPGIEDVDLDRERAVLTEKLGMEPTEQQLVLYLQHPNDAVDFFKFEETYGKAYVLPPAIFFREGGFALGDKLTFKDHFGKEHVVEIGPTQKTELGETNVYLNVDHDQRLYLFEPELQPGVRAEVKLSKEEIAALAAEGDIRAPFAGTICAVSVEIGDEIGVGDQLAVIEAMKMENEILSPASGTVKEVRVKAGDSVNTGDTLVIIGLGGNEMDLYFTALKGILDQSGRYGALPEAML